MNSPTPYERLMAEQIPTRPPPPPTQPGPARPIRPWTPEEQTQHVADLLDALDGWAWHEDERAQQRRHLRLLETDEPETLADMNVNKREAG
jgi:hypothetical protein